MDKTKTILWLLYYLFWAFFPWIFENTIATMRTDWWVIPVLIMNGFAQGSYFIYKLKMINKYAL